jgi:hypothetical protein
MKQMVKSRYGAYRIFFYEDSKWYVDLKETHFVRFIGGGNGIAAIDPEGGPYIAIGDKLSDVATFLPDITISKLRRIKPGVYQLT